MGMDERIKSIKSQMSEASNEAASAFGSLTAEQLNWKPSDKGWSVGQCIDHIVRTNRQFFPEFDRLAAGDRQNSFWEKWSPFTGLGGRFLIRAVSEDSKKAKAPSKALVPPSDITTDIINRFSTHVEEVNEKIEACSTADRQSTVVTSPFLRILTYKLDDALTVLVEHTKRHIRQAKRVMGTEGFPR